MSITSVYLLPDEGEQIRLDLRDPNAQSQFIVRNIVGIDADEIVPRFYGFSKDGLKRFYDLRLPQREIVIRVVLNPRYNTGEDISYLRNIIYKTISSTRSGEIGVEFRDGASVHSRVYGHIIKLEVAHFSNVPELQLTVRCNDPMFRSISSVLLGSDELSFSNPVIIGDSSSTAPHGFSMKVTFTDTTPDFTIQNSVTDPEWDFKVVPSTDFLSGDELYFSSEFNNRYLYMVRSSVTTHLLDRIEPTSVWPIIFPGINQFYFPDVASFTWDYIRFYSAFWGL